MSDLQYDTQAAAIAAENRYSLEMGFQLPESVRATRKWSDIKSSGGKYYIPDPGIYTKVLTFEDDFSGAALDTTKWNTRYWYGRTNSGNAELQWFLDANATASNGTGKLTAKNETTVQSGVTYNYTSGIISSHDKFSQLYGYFEASIKIPGGQGLWPGFWMLPQDRTWPPELDIAEILGQEPGKAYFTEHYGTSQNHQQSTGSHTNNSSFADGFNTFAMLWTPNVIKWYVNGIERYSTTTNIPNTAMYLILDLAVGGTWPGSPDGTTVFPATMEIEYVRAWSIT